MSDRITCAKCGRSQSWIGKEAIEFIGWRLMEAGWWCPFCTGHTANLKRIFEKGTEE